MTLNNNILVTLFIVTIASVHHVQSARILFISATPSPSHQKPFQQIWKALALRGHEMHVVTPNPLANNTIENLVQYNISEVYLLAAEFNKNHKQKVRFTLEKPSFLGTFSKELVLHKGWHFLFEYTFKLEEMQKLIKTKPKFDAVIVEWLFPTMAAFGAYFEAPLIGITSLGAPTNALDAIGNILNPVVSPDQNIPLRRELSFRDRLLSVLYSAYIRTLYHWVILPNEDKVAKQYLGKDLPYLGNIERNVSLLLLNRNQISHRIMSVVPGVIEFGGFDYPKVASVLSPELKRYLDNSKNGVVYFSLGAAIKMAEFLSTQQVEIFKEVLGTLPYNVLWKWENTSMDNQPKNVYTSQWINQTAVLVFAWFLLQFRNVESAKILFVACSPAPSHQKPFQIIWKELSLRGHEVHVLTPNPLNDTNLSNLTEYDLSDFYEVLKKYNTDDVKYVLKKPDFLTVFLKDAFMTKIWSGMYVRTLKHPETKRLLENNDYFDVVITEWLFPTMAALAPYFNAQLIGISSLGAPVVALDTLGNPSHPIIAPDMNLPVTRSMTLKERLMASLYAFYVRMYYHMVVLPREDQNIKELLKHDLPYIGDIERNVSLLLLNRNPVFHRVMPIMPATIELGGIKFPKVIQTLESELQKFIESSKYGTVYFSLGSSMKSNLLPRNIIILFKEVFESLPLNVIWKWENDTMEDKPDNVFLGKWIPQTAVLEHPNVKLFITQGGLQSTEEAIAAHKPIIGIPFHSDQTTNVDTCVKYGMGKMLDLEELSVEKLRSYILEIINDPSYAENAKKLDELMKDQPMDGLEKAIWWIEYVIRHKGARHLRSVAVDLPWWQYLMLDVIGFVSVVLFLIFLVLYLICRFIFRCLFGRIRRKKEGKKNKKD